MLKKDFVNLIQDMEDDVDIDETILSQGFAKPIQDVEGFNSLLASNKDIQGIFDKKVKGAIDTFKGNGMQKLIEAEVIKRTGGKEETTEQKLIRELQERLDKSDREKAKAEMVAKFKDTLTEKKIPTKMVDFLLGQDEETTNANITLFEDSMKSYIESGIQERLGESSYIPPKSDGAIGKITWEQVQENPSLLPQYNQQSK
jgi:hypothetical protein